uniref:glucose-6-phosphate 1-epimerase n=1 Tax=Wollemia nobilis TaxID=56998 RepID=A0A0C9QXV6_9CONI
MAIAAASLLSSSTQCPRERISFRKTGWALGNQRFSDHNCMKRSLLHPSVRRNSSRVYPRLQATFNTVNAAITADKLNQEIGCLGVKAEEGEGKLAKLVLKSSGGSEVEIYLFGGCISSWKTSKGKDLLFVRPDAVFNGQKPISGGIPHCFPQFGPGPMQQHGFARNMTWSVVSSANPEGNPMVTLELKDDSYTHSMWDFNFLATYKVTLESDRLSTELVVKNTDDKAFSFTAALHTYFHASVTGASVKGLKGCKTLNKFPDPLNPIESLEEREVVNFPGFVDCVYLGAPEKLLLENGLGDTISVENKNWEDAVLWNPHMQMEACYKDFVCVENAKIGKVELQPGQTWTGEQYLSAS